MKTYEVTFTGRKVGAIGKFHHVRAQVFAEHENNALLALYDRFEHVMEPKIKEIESPFDSDGLVNRIQNTQEEWQVVRLRVEQLRDAIDEYAKRQARANTEWHDDEESADHGLYHAKADLQFPRAQRDKALLELVSRHLEVLNENESALAAD